MNSLRKFVTGAPMQLAKREWRTVGKWRGLISAVAIGLLLGVTGPFGSQHAYPRAVKYSFWMAVALAGIVAAVAAERVLPRSGPRRTSLPRLLLIAAASAVPMTFFVAWAMGVIKPGRTFSPVQMLGLFPYVALVQLLIARVLAQDDPPQPTAPSEEPAAPAQYPPEFVAKLPVALRRDILALEAEDHYVRVHSRHGSALLLMRLADAAALIDPRLGVRVHRSWWVAKDGVRAIERKSGRSVARLIDDREIPVSRSYLAAARTFFAD